MSSQMSIGIEASELSQIVASVFETMMGLEVWCDEADWTPGTDRMTATVHLTGDWNGALLVECDQRQACILAGRFLSMEVPETVDDVVRDVLGEIANMVGGNLKCIMTSGIRLSMPTVVDGSSYAMRICGSDVCERLSFACEAGRFWITALETPESTVPRPQPSV